MVYSVVFYSVAEICNYSVAEICNISSKHFLWHLSNSTDSGVFEAWVSTETSRRRVFIRETKQCVPPFVVDSWDWHYDIQRCVDCLHTFSVKASCYSINTYVHVKSL